MLSWQECSTTLSPSLPESITDISGVSLFLPESITDISGVSPFLPESITDISGVSRFLPESITDISGVSPFLPESITDIIIRASPFLPESIADISGVDHTHHVLSTGPQSTSSSRAGTMSHLSSGISCFRCTHLSRSSEDKEMLGKGGVQALPAPLS